MNLNQVLNNGTEAGSETTTFYHVSTEVEAFRSFFREGAKASGKGVGGQTDGLYVWTNEKAAERHIHFLNSDAWANKNLTNKEAMLIGLTIPKDDITYPLWQQDLEQSKGIYELCITYGDFLNEKAHNLNITIKNEERPFGWPFEKITGFVVEKEKTPPDTLLFIGIDKSGKTRRKMCPSTPPWEACDSIKFQILTDWLCQNNPDFQKDYNKLMQKIMLDKNGTGLKYTGSKPLPIAFAEYVKINEDDSFTKETVFDAKKGKNQVCPFLKMNSIREK